MVSLGQDILGVFIVELEKFYVINPISIAIFVGDGK